MKHYLMFILVAFCLLLIVAAIPRRGAMRHYMTASAGAACDASLVIQGGHRIFIQRFHIEDEAARPQWLDHVDSGILKVKIALSIAGITLVQILKDFVHLERVEWDLTKHRIVVHVVALVSALMMALIWRVTHPAWAQGGSHEDAH